MLRLVNAARATAGCRALTSNATLVGVARAHSRDMGEHGYFSHDSQDGRSPFDRMRAAGYRGTLMGENIAAGQPTAAAVMDAWMKSPGHRANILNCGFSEIGVGVATVAGSPMRVYWTQDFGDR
ncbi:MAG TPA: CAP domain-containing protein [Kineosporiaceae bacterium]|nr:CAP domain-containing protein [Kineosporiaceae bacterium]